MPSQRVNSEIKRLSVPAEVGLTIVSASGQSADLTQWQGSTGTVLAKVDSAGLFTLPNVSVTSSTIPANGIYLPSANTLGFATNSVVRMQINSVGEIGVGTGAFTGYTLAIAKNITGSVNSQVVAAYGNVQSDVTNTANYFATYAGTQAASFTLTSLYHFQAGQGTFGVGSTVTNQYGFFIGNVTGATNNFGFFGNIASGNARWNFYANGTAANYFAGQTTVGSTSLTLGGGSAAQQFGVVSAAATNVGIVVRGAASQTGNLQEWQNSAGTVLSAFDSAGRLGLGVSAPSEMLQVSGNAYISSSSAAATTPLKLNNSDTSGTATVKLGFSSTGTVKASINAAVYGNDYLAFNTGSDTERIRIDASGNLLIGVTTAATTSAKTINIANGTAPTANITGGVLYVESGALKYRGSSGTVTTIANA